MHLLPRMPVNRLLTATRCACAHPTPPSHQALAVTTLGCNRSAQRIDTMAEEDEEQRFYLQVKSFVPGWPSQGWLCRSVAGTQSTRCMQLLFAGVCTSVAG